MKKIMALLAALILVLAMGFASGSPAQATNDHQITICHATGNPGHYSTPNPTKQQIFEGGGHKNGNESSVHPGDIIPPFTAGSHGGQSWGAFAGQNWTTVVFNGQTGAQIYAAGCVTTPPVEEDTPVTPNAVGVPDDCDEDPFGTITVTAVKGVTYQLQDGSVITGTIPANGTNTVTAVLDEGFVLADGAVGTWTFTSTPATDCGGSSDTEITPEVVVTDKCGTKNDSVEGVVKVGYTFETTNVGLQYFTQFEPVEGFVLVGDNPIINVLTDKACPDTPDNPDNPSNPNNPDNPKTVSHPKGPEDKPEAHKKNGPVAVPTVIDSGL